MEAGAEEEAEEELDEEEEEDNDDDDDDDEVELMLYGGFKLRAAEPLILHACMENESHKFHNLPIQYSSNAAGEETKQQAIKKTKSKHKMRSITPIGVEHRKRQVRKMQSESQHNWHLANEPDA
ncbi:hypothetical protein T10_408 [Trichinella papuae]|uniref:Uncharacterized protein n=1 Tax=Trichinella papuae TaxID=268474 RepID=A0A0V1MM41_9BILA|nr:hypothetical protein T10_408 [Trichinella papuae]